MQRPHEKIIRSLKDLAIVSRHLKDAGETVVLTSGCFDIVHPGHLEYLCDAAEKGALIVGINSDISVKKLKGDSRPVNKEGDRMLVIAGFYPTRFITVFDDDCELIAAVMPHIYIASPTSNVDIETDTARMTLLRSIGTELCMQDTKRPDCSTTNIISKTSAR